MTEQYASKDEYYLSKLRALKAELAEAQQQVDYIHMHNFKKGAIDKINDLERQLAEAQEQRDQFKRDSDRWQHELKLLAQKYESEVAYGKLMNERFSNTSKRLAEAQERIDYITAERDALAYDVTRKQAMQAIELFESEYIGQDAVELWDWALTRVMTEDILATDKEGEK